MTQLKVPSINIDDYQSLYTRPQNDLERTRITQFERIPTYIHSSIELASIQIANEIVETINKNESKGKKTVLGIISGTSPISVYKELIVRYRSNQVSFQNTVVFTTDEFYPLQSLEDSYFRSIEENFLQHIDIPKENIHYLDPTILPDEITVYCKQYEAKIEEMGGIDYQILGVSKTGAVGCNPPGSFLNSTTRVVLLDEESKQLASGNTFEAPNHAITMGIETLKKAKKIAIIASGDTKASIINEIVEGESNATVPASWLQLHNDISVHIDFPASAKLTRMETPWLVDSCQWTDMLVRKAIVWLCEKVNKPILKLTTKDYFAHNLGQLIEKYESAYVVNIKVFNDLQHTITGWPGGKPDSDDSDRPERALPHKKRVMIFSPHPDDDVVSMGATFRRLVQQEHEVHVCYQTSGNFAVEKHEVERFINFSKALASSFSVENTFSKRLDQVMTKLPKQRHPRTPLPADYLTVSRLIREGEAELACKYVKLPVENIHYLKLPFYETGKAQKKPLAEEDVQITMDILQKIKPHQIYAAGDFTDPHGTHRVCLNVLLIALDRLQSEPWMKDCWTWLYRGAWQEWDTYQIEMAVPMSPEELKHKKRAILMHQSQMESAPFMGGDDRLFWERAQDRNRNTALLYHRLGFAEYEAIEAFVRYKPTQK